MLNKLIKKIKEKEDFKEILKKGGSALFLKFGGFLFGYLFVIAIIRWYGAEANGIYSLSTTILFILSIISRLGLDTGLVKYTANLNLEGRFNEIRAILNKSTKAVLIVSSSISILLYFLSEFISIGLMNKPEMIMPLKAVALSIPFWSITLLNAAIFRGLKLISWYSFYFQVSKFSLACLILFASFFIFNFLQPQAAIVSFVLAIVIIGIISSAHVYYILKNKPSEDQISGLDFKEVLKTSLPMLLTSSLLFLNGWIDTLILGIFASTESVGIYSVAIKIATLVSFILNAINAISMPKFAELYHSKQFKRLENVVTFNAFLIFVFCFPIFLGIITFPTFFLNLFGPNLESAKFPLIILCAGQLVNALCGSVSYLLQMSGHQKIVSRVITITLILNIITNIMLVGPYGMLGVSIASAASLIFWNIVLSYFAYKKLKIQAFFNPIKVFRYYTNKTERN